MCSVPEPDPEKKGTEVTASLLEHVKDYRHVVALIRERHAFGLKKYGKGRGAPFGCMKISLRGAVCVCALRDVCPPGPKGPSLRGAVCVCVCANTHTLFLQRMRVKSWVICFSMCTRFMVTTCMKNTPHKNIAILRVCGTT